MPLAYGSYSATSHLTSRELSEPLTQFAMMVRRSTMCRLFAFLSLQLILRGANSVNVTELLASGDGWKVMVDEQRGTHTIDDERVPHGAGCGSALLDMTSTAELDALLDGGTDGEGGTRLAIFFVYGSGAEATRMRAAAALAAATAPASVLVSVVFTATRHG